MSNDPNQPQPLNEDTADWRAMKMTIEALSQQLTNMTAQRDDAVAALQNAGAQHDAERNGFTVRLWGAVQERDDARAERTRAKNRLTLLAAVAHDVFEDWLLTYSPFPDDVLTPEWRIRRKNVREMMVLIESECM